MRNILFYKYVEIADPNGFREEQLQLLLSLQLKGKILVAHEGINGCLTGEEEAIEHYKQALRADPRFADIEFKEGITREHGFRKTVVRVKPEIVASKTTVNLSNKAPYISAEELKLLLESDEEVLLLDARNNYESAIGRFENAITPDIGVFRDFNQYVQSIAHLKDKQIVTYCTGGIRCEKASAVLKENGFTNVRQLHGGIIKYGEVVGTDHWEGKCFVFDTRGAINIEPGKQSEPIAKCVGCNLPADKYYNCAHLSCDKMFIACETCVNSLAGCCCKQCKNQRAKAQS